MISKYSFIHLAGKKKIQTFCAVPRKVVNIIYSVRQKKRAHRTFCDGTLPIFRGGWKVIIDVKQHSQPLLRVRNRGGEVILSKKTPQLKRRGPKKGNKAVF